MADFLVSELTKSVGDKTLFDKISFIIHDLDHIGLLGTNGTGKTTLLNTIAGIQGFDGDVSPFTHPQDYKITYLTQEPDFDNTASIMDTVLDDSLPQMKAIKRYEAALLNIEDLSKFERAQSDMDALNAWQVEADVKTVLTKLKLPDFSSKIGSLSGGQKRRVQLAQALVNPSDLLLLDEPTNHLDVDTIAWLQNYLKNSKRTVLFVTHDRYFLDNVATRIFELDKSKLKEYQGNYQNYLAQRAEAEEREAASLHKNQQLYKSELAWIRKSPQARATKQQARIDRFESLKEDVRTDKDLGDVDISLATTRLGKKVINFEDAAFAFPDRPIFSDLNWIVQNKSRVGIVGDNGVGKSTLLNIIAGELELTSGTMDIGETVKIGYFSQEIRGLEEDKRIINFLEEVASASQNTSGETISIVYLLEQFLFPRSTHGTLIRKLSGGEKKRLYLLKILLTQPNVLLLDEPTNDLDIATLTVLEDFLAKFPGAVITVSHDRYFQDKVSNELLAFEDGKINHLFGAYSDYLATKVAAPAEVATPKADTRVREETKPRMTWAEKQEWATIEDDIANLEARIEEIDTEMNENGSDAGMLSTLQKELDQVTTELETKYERWEMLSEKI
ncbi:ABC-F family ATP-binding cassette domain-containing protein [Lactococcus garvieae]|uniref:ABC transporter ATP-binding component n=1 Tax=Lactococcus garvieae (strain Lg2) TaxID=420890 RepID=F9VEB7_LACGL|nr:ABC-F family ATP-binding cassette domain-containing protein [Lactococcus garvieae]EOT33226.1 ATP-binding cassette, subfamily F, uup [Lactococcus garvieae ATCC 49156]EOT93265.1 ATP-binding cassette, subfamily F, uup [Lactococcus garvieae ATCC 49156]BAK58701.1 ABC transporter ATP-binding component [Lactococcus garvieae ATCC 49156]BAK60668.1 ABC transporter ATP-binding component [Lactococcus garvieae Lg2]BDW47549.1 ABC transporter ATP-binding protein [Lactococcus garvieae]